MASSKDRERDKEDWYKLITKFRQTRDLKLFENDITNNPRLKFDSTDAVVDSVLQIIGNITDRDEIFKIYLLIFLQENASQLIDNHTTMEKVCAVCNNILTQDDGNSMHLQSQIIITVTTVLIELSVIRTHTRIFESFVEVLFDIIQKVNSGQDRMLRETGCYCLQELELAYPGLLSHTLGHLLSYCNSENTHACQAYMTLFSTVLKHATVQILEDLQSNLGEIPKSILSTEFEPTPFSLPHSVKYIPLQMFTQATKYLDNKGGQLPEAINKEVRKCVSYLIDNCQYLTRWGLQFIILQLLPFVYFTDLPKDGLKHQLWRLSASHIPMYIHVFLLLKLNFPDTFTPEEQSVLVMQLFYSIRDINLSVEQRIQMMQLLLKFPLSATADQGAFSKNITSITSLLNPSYPEFYPSVFDPPMLKNARLQALLECFDPFPPFIPPSDLLQSLQCLSEFRFRTSNHQTTSIVFNTLQRILLKFPDLFEAVLQFLFDTVITLPKFLPTLIKLIANVQKAKRTDISQKLLIRFNEKLLTMDKNTLTMFLDLAFVIVKEKTIDPRPLLNAILDMLRKTPAVEYSWKFGNGLLAVCRQTMLSHDCVIIFQPLTEILGIVSNYFSDLEVRDRSYFYYMLLSHVPQDKIKIILTQQESVDDDNQVIPPTPMVNFSKQKSIKQINTPFLQMVPLPPSVFGKPFLISQEQQVASSEDPSTSPNFFGYDSEGKPIIIADTSAIHQYLSMIMNSASQKYQKHIRKSFVLKFKEQVDSNTPGNFREIPTVNPTFRASSNTIQIEVSKKIPETVFSLVLDFGDSPIYQKLNSVRIPVLTKQNTTSSEDTTVAFPFEYRIELDFYPLVPLPTSFEVSTMFNDMDGKVHKAPMEHLFLEFVDLLLPPQVPESTTLSRSEFLDRVFDDLWNRVLQPNLGETSTDPKINRQMAGSKSVKFFQLPHNIVQKMISKYLQAFQVPQARKKPSQPTENELPQEQPLRVERMLIFLPPKYHILLKFKIFEKLTTVKVRTDFWRVLTYMDEFLDVLACVVQ